MSKKKRNNQSRRDTRSITNRYTPVAVTSSVPWSIVVNNTHADHRQFRPDLVYNPVLLSGKSSRRILRDPNRFRDPKNFAILKNLSQTKAKLKQYSPLRTLICIRRKIRDEVLHALGKTGKGGSNNRKPKFNHNSEVLC